MARMYETKPPAWFWAAAVLLVLWECMGVWSWWEHWRHGPSAMGNVPTDYDVRYFAALPGWYVWLFGAAVWTGLIGGILLLVRNAGARAAYIVSLIATVLMFGYTFLATDLIAAKGVWTTYFPALIILAGIFSVWFAGYATKRGWLR